MDSEQAGSLPLDLEARIQSLLTCTLAPDETAELLLRIVRDDRTRRGVLEMLELDRQARRCLGLDVDDEAIRSGLTETLAAVRREREKGHRPGAQRLWPRVVWSAARIAAVLVIGALICLLALNRRQVRALRDRVVVAEWSVGMADLTAGEMAAIRQVWQQVNKGSGNLRPWVLMTDGTGEFGYLPADSKAPASSGPMLLRCAIVADDRHVTQFNMLLSAEQATRLTVPAAGRVADRPIDISVSASAGQADVDVKVGGTSGAQAGVRGRAPIDGRDVEIGQFRLEGRKMTVVLQATDMHGSMM